MVPANSSPDILLIIADDMGVHQLGCHGSTFYETPNLDRLASEGVRFTRAYSASPVCSPARAALYTGLHPARLHLTNFIPGTEPANPRLLTPAWRPFLPVAIDTLGDLCKAGGYTTAHFGKWHLAPDYHYEPGREMDPESQGFEHVVVTRKPKVDADPESDPHHIARLTDEAIRFLTAPRDQPAVCVLAHNALHRPELAPAALVEKYQRKPGADEDGNRPVIAAMVEELDSNLGRLMAALQKTERGRDTLVVFTSDHGAFGCSPNRKPLRGAKADLYEGGIRVPLIFHRPGRLAAAVREQCVIGMDLLPTLLGFAGLPVPGNLDGRSLQPVLASADAPPPHEMLCWHFPHYHHLGLAPCGAVRRGDWKLIEWFDASLGSDTAGPAYELFDLAADPWEQRNLASDQPALRDELAQRLRHWRRDVGAQEMAPNPDFDPTAGGMRAGPPPGDPGNPFGE
ncbi:MAG: sulfatase [Opitutaceae bacterium]|nr:sulfatase [Cephaloticoccus sp.]MCP5530202.1 sulfatase [Opitutaceae bacterium]